MIFSSQLYVQNMHVNERHFIAFFQVILKGLTTQPSKPDNTQPSLTALTNALQASCPDSAVFQLAIVNRCGDAVSEDSNVAHTVDVHTSTVTCLPQPLCDLARQFTNADDFMVAIRYSDAQREKITKSTVRQSCEDVWFIRQQGRIRGSVMYLVFTKSKIISKQFVDTVPIVS